MYSNNVCIFKVGIWNIELFLNLKVDIKMFSFVYIKLLIS